MGMTNGRTICSKHDEIMKLAEGIQSLCQGDVNPSDLSDLFSDIQDKAEQIDQLAADAKEDGQSMESGLDEKRERIDKLEEAEIDLKEAYEIIETQDETLENLREKIRELEEKLTDAESIIRERNYEDLES